MKNLLKKESVNIIYRTCEEMPLWNFSKYLKTNELKYFTKELIEIEGLQDVMVAFFDEYIALSESSQAMESLRIMNEIMRLSNKYDTVSLAILGIHSYRTDFGIEILQSHIDTLSHFNYKIDKEKELFGQVEKIATRIQGIKTKIELLKPEAKEENAKEAQSIESQMITVSRILMLPYRIDPKITTVAEWIEMNKQCIEIAEKQKTSRHAS